LIIEIVDSFEDFFVFVGVVFFDDKDESVIIISTVFFVICVFVGHLIVPVDFFLSEKSIIYSIVPISDKIVFDSEFIEKFVSRFVGSFSVDVNDFVGSY